jgi:replicative DNA helicase
VNPLPATASTTASFVLQCFLYEGGNMGICRKKHRNEPTGKVQLAWMEQYTKLASLTRRV